MASSKRLFLFCLLAVSVAAAVWVSDAPEGTDGPVAPVSERVKMPRKETTSNAQTGERLALLMDNLQRMPITVGDLDPFGTKSWYVAPPPSPPLPAPPPTPTAPPLPFTYVGKLQEEGGRWIIYLAKGEQSYAVSKGETFDSDYRLEGIENGNLTIQYLPLSTKQILPIGSES